MKTSLLAILAATLATFAVAEPQPQPAPTIPLIAAEPVSLPPPLITQHETFPNPSPEALVLAERTEPPQGMGLAAREPAIIAKAPEAVSVVAREPIMDEHGHRVYRSFNRGPQVKRRCGNGCSCGAGCACSGCSKHAQRDVVFPKRIPVPNAKPATAE